MIHDLRQRAPLVAVRASTQVHPDVGEHHRPADALKVAPELAAGLDVRIRELGERMIQRPQPWLLKHLGMLAPDASPALREDYARRAGIAAGYSETVGITDSGQANSPHPHRANPELDAMRSSTMKALAIPENPYATMTRGELEARILDGERAQETAPPEVTSQLRLTPRTERRVWTYSRLVLTRPRTESRSATPSGEPERSTRPASGAKPRPKPNQLPNAKPRSRTGSTSRCSSGRVPGVRSAARKHVSHEA